MKSSMLDSERLLPDSGDTPSLAPFSVHLLSELTVTHTELQLKHEITSQMNKFISQQLLGAKVIHEGSYGSQKRREMFLFMMDLTFFLCFHTNIFI